MPDHYTKVGGVWKKSNKLYTRQGGVWKEITNGYVKQSGAWKKFYTKSIPPTGVMTAVQAASGTAGSTKTYSSIAIGTADATRFIVVMVCHPANAGGSYGTLTCKIGGVTAPRLKTKPSTYNGNDVFGLSVPTGTFTDVVIGGSSTSQHFMITVFALYNLASTTPTGFYTNGLQSGPNNTAFTASINTSADGIALGIATTISGNNLYGTWAGLTQTGYALGKATNTMTAFISAAMASGVAAATPRSITWTATTSSANAQLLACTTISFR